ncbi:MAG: hypothetical protein AAF629_07635, partial [Chloroflexota bacterium]
MKPWKTLKKRTLLHHSKYLTVESHDIALPDGQILEDWAWAQIPDAVHVVAITEAGEYLCFRQTKYAVDGVTMATVAGYLDPNELPLPPLKLGDCVAAATAALKANRVMAAVRCEHCGTLYLDQGDFATRKHVTHICVHGRGKHFKIAPAIQGNPLAAFGAMLAKDGALMLARLPTAADYAQQAQPRPENVRSHVGMESCTP